LAKETSVSTGDGGFGKVVESERQVDVYVGSKGGDSGSSKEHCHAWADKSTGDHGVVHRGGCDQCKGDKGKK